MTTKVPINTAQGRKATTPRSSPPHCPPAILPRHHRAAAEEKKEGNKLLHPPAPPTTKSNTTHELLRRQAPLPSVVQTWHNIMPPTAHSIVRAADEAVNLVTSF